MIKFKELTIEGFGSIVKPMSIALNKKGFHLIKGKNGQGKTTLVSALCWVLYGQPIKPKSSIATWPKYRDKSWRGTQVSITMSIDGKPYKITRTEDFKGSSNTRKESRLEIQGELKEGLRNKPDFQKFIETDLLRMSFTLFKNSVIFGQKLKRIIEEGSTDKKEVFEEAFNILFIQEAKTLLDKDMGIKSLEIKDLNREIENLESRLGKANEVIDNLQNIKESVLKLESTHLKDLSKKREEKQSLKQELERESAKINKLKLELKPAQEKLGIKISASKDKITAISDKILKARKIGWEHEDLARKLDKLNKTEIQKTCPVCKSPLNQKVINELEEKRNAEIREILSKLDAKESNKERLNKLIEKEKQIKVQLEELNSKLGQLNENLVDTQNNITLLSKNINRISLEMQSMKKAYKESTKDLDYQQWLEKSYAEVALITRDKELRAEELRKCQEEYEDMVWLSSVALSNSGIKAYLLEVMLKQVNSQLRNYSLYIGLRVEININLSSARKDFQVFIYRNNEVCVYQDLSGGQQQLVNVAMALAIHDVVSSTNERNTNLMVMDEVFEGLDEENIELVADMLKLKSKEKSIFIITHQKPFNVSNSKVINLKYEAGITSLA